MPRLIYLRSCILTEILADGVSVQPEIFFINIIYLCKKIYALVVQRDVQQMETAVNAQMELIATNDKGPLTMSSREIAKLCEK